MSLVGALYRCEECRDGRSGSGGGRRCYDKGHKLSANGASFSAFVSQNDLRADFTPLASRHGTLRSLRQTLHHKSRYSTCAGAAVCALSACL